MKIKNILFGSIGLALLASCSSPKSEESNMEPIDTVAQGEFQYQTEQFADLKIIRYQIPDFDKLTAQQKELVYYLYKASLSGRDIIWDQNYKHNLVIRRALEGIVSSYAGDKSSKDWQSFMVYTKRVWFSNGIHHHYSMTKLKPEFSVEYFNQLLSESNTELAPEIVSIMFDDKTDMKRVNLDPAKDLIAGSANNFYEDGITTKEVEDYYSRIIDRNDSEPISYGLNSTLRRDKNGKFLTKDKIS